MRRRLGTVLFAAAIAVVASPADAERRNDAETSATIVAVPRSNFPTGGLREEAAMVIVGTLLLGVAAAVRRAA